NFWYLSRTVAVVGISDKLGRPSLTVASYLKDHGYDVWPVNPTIKEVGHVLCYPDLSSLPGVPDLVVVFRKASDIPGVVDEAIQAKVSRVWVQEGIESPEGWNKAKSAGLSIAMNLCIMKEYMRLKASETGEVCSIKKH
ncbi:CoA-binding domain protein, partial [mine drainage metagenome]